MIMLHISCKEHNEILITVEMNQTIISARILQDSKTELMLFVYYIAITLILSVIKKTN